MDEELRELLSIFPEVDFATSGLDVVRARVSELAAAAAAPEGLAVDERQLQISGGDKQPLELLIYVPSLADWSVPVVLHIHGGGFVFGSAKDDRVANMVLASTLQCAIVSVDYRLAPETPYPGPLEDCYAALVWVSRHAAEFGGDSSRIALLGQSAGGGLAATLAMLARDRSEVPIIHQHLIYPMLDDKTGAGRTPSPGAGQHVWTRESNAFGWTAYLGPSAPASPYAAASRMCDLRGLPPTFISVGALDLFARENLEFAARLVDAEVPVELHLYPGAFHGFDLWPPARVSARARDNSVEALRRALFG